MKEGLLAITTSLLLVSLFFAGCAGNAGGEKTTIKVSGAFALYPMMVKWAEEYQKIHPDVRIDISAGGAGKGMTDALAGMTDIGMVSREIDPTEIVRGAFPIKVAKDAVVVVANAKNPAAGELNKKGVGKRLLQRMYLEGEGMKWSEIANAGEGLKWSEISNGGDGTKTQEVANAGETEATFFRRSDSCGASETFAKYLGAQSQDELKGAGVYGDPGIVEAVKSDKFSIGYANLNFAYDAKTQKPQEGIIIVPLEGTESAIYESKKTLVGAIGEGKYPSPPARDLYIVGKGGFSGKAKDFVMWILTDGQKYVDEAGYVAIDEKTLGEERAKVA